MSDRPESNYIGRTAQENGDIGGGSGPIRKDRVLCVLKKPPVPRAWLACTSFVSFPRFWTGIILFYTSFGWWTMLPAQLPQTLVDAVHRTLAARMAHPQSVMEPRDDELGLLGQLNQPRKQTDASVFPDRH